MMSRQDIIKHRKNKFLNIGRDKDVSNDLLSSNKLFSGRVDNFFDFKNKLINKKTYFFIFVFIISAIFLIIFNK